MEKKEKIYFKRNKYRKDDFSINDLPLTRRKQFFDIFKNDWKTLLLLGLILLLFSIPYLAIDGIHWFIKFNLPTQLYGDEVTEEMVNQAMKLTEILYEVCLVITSLFVSIALAGSARVLKRLVHAEGVLFKEDFFQGIKMNSLQFLLLMFIYSSLRFASRAVYIYISDIPIYSDIVLGVSTGILFLLFVPILLFMFSECSIYKMKFITNFKNSYQLAIHSYLWIVIFSIIIFGVYFMRYIEHPILRIGLDSLIILLSPIYLLSLSLFTMSKFDIFINKDNYKDIYRKGLKPLE